MTEPGSEPSRPGRRSLSSRLLGWYAVVVVVFIALFAALVTSEMRRILLSDLTGSLAAQARTVSVALEEGDDLQGRVEALASAGSVRITLVGADGKVLADSERDPATMEDHGARPEVVAARGGAVGIDRRVSVSTGRPTLYVAIPPGVSAPGRVVRVAVTEERVAAELADVRNAVVGLAAAAAVVGVVAVGLVARRLVRPLAELTHVAGRVAEGDLSVRPRRSSVAELDRLGLAVGGMASELGRRVEESEEERRTLEVVLAALPQGVVLVEADDDVAYANPSAHALLEGVAERLVGIGPPGLQRIVREARSEGRPSVLEFEYGVPVRSLQAMATPFAGDDGRVLLVVSDVTERRRVERMRRDFVADASHELKTPLASILASIEALRLALGRDPERAEGFLSQVEASSSQLARIVEDLLDLSRLESAELRGERVRVDRVAAEEVERIRPRAEQEGVSLTLETAPVEVMGSPSDLALAIRNLCDNAIRHTRAGGSVTVRVGTSDGGAVLEVEDTGSGIPTRALPRIFERFYRVDVARSRGSGGTGLGLAIVKHVAERHGGRVSAESELGAGSLFRMELPPVAPRG